MIITDRLASAKSNICKRYLTVTNTLIVVTCLTSIQKTVGCYLIIVWLLFGCYTLHTCCLKPLYVKLDRCTLAKEYKRDHLCLTLPNV